MLHKFQHVQRASPCKIIFKSLVNLVQWLLAATESHHVQVESFWLEVSFQGKTSRTIWVFICQAPSSGFFDVFCAQRAFTQTAQRCRFARLRVSLQLRAI